MRIRSPSARRALARAAAAVTVAIAATGVPAFAAPDDSEPLVAPPTEKVVADAPAADVRASLAEPSAVGLLRQLHERTSEMAVATMDFVGIRYRRGGASVETGFDCSGFTRHVFAMSLGMVLPRRADEQATAPGFVAVKRDDLQPGDLVFFNTLKRSFSHVGIYLGANRFIHAPRSGASIRTEDMSFAYWAKRYEGARRFAGTAAAAAKTVSPAAAQATPAGGE
jgi:cell wall-associated NlpC family hydrolase